MKDSPFVGLAGNIGVGKTTFTKKMAATFNWTPIYESVSDNPYLNDFYTDMNRWSFNLQIYFLQKSLDFDKGGQLANNLYRLYEFCKLTVQDAVMSGQPEKSNLEACSKYVGEIIESWEKIY